MLHDILTLSLGASLVSVGVLSSALADRIRGLRIERRMSRPERQREIPDEIATERTRPARGSGPKMVEDPALTATAQNVIAVLVASGYKKSLATDATWRCTTVERATTESWTRAALRNCARPEVVS